MNALELRQAAKNVSGSTIHAIGWVGMIADSKRLARHILETVREDDDDPVSEEWAAALPIVTYHDPGNSVTYLSGFKLFFGYNGQLPACCLSKNSTS